MITHYKLLQTNEPCGRVIPGSAGVDIMFTQYKLLQTNEPCERVAPGSTGVGMYSYYKLQTN